MAGLGAWDSARLACRCRAGMLDVPCAAPFTPATLGSTLLAAMAPPSVARARPSHVSRHLPAARRCSGSRHSWRRSQAALPWRSSAQGTRALPPSWSWQSGGGVGWRGGGARSRSAMMLRGGHGMLSMLSLLRVGHCGGKHAELHHSGRSGTTTRALQLTSRSTRLGRRFGKALVVAEVDRVEPLLYPLLRRDLLQQGSHPAVLIGDKLVSSRPYPAWPVCPRIDPPKCVLDASCSQLTQAPFCPAPPRWTTTSRSGCCW
jgi:hypothetical protein